MYPRKAYPGFPTLTLMPFHWGDLFHAETNANYVTNSAFDPVSKQPELKFCAVQIEPDNM